MRVAEWVKNKLTSHVSQSDYTGNVCTCNMGGKEEIQYENNGNHKQHKQAHAQTQTHTHTHTHTRTSTGGTRTAKHKSTHAGARAGTHTRTHTSAPTTREPNNQQEMRDTRAVKPDHSTRLAIPKRIFQSYAESQGTRVG